MEPAALNFFDDTGWWAPQLIADPLAGHAKYQRITLISIRGIRC
jgi:hypothetical protein